MDFRAYSAAPLGHPLTGYPIVFCLATIIGWGTTMAISFSPSIQDLPFPVMFDSFLLVIVGLVAVLESQRYKRALKKMEN
jgi:uncharacterized protein YceK